MPMISSINKSVGSGMNYTVKNWFAKSLEKGLKHPAEYAALMMVTSLITKDAVNCGLYTYQSLHNEKIPKENRGFVAALDLANGVINVFGQIGAFVLVERYLTPWLETKFTGVSKNPKTKEETILSKTKASLHPDAVNLDALNVLKEKEKELRSALKGTDVSYEMLRKNPQEVIDGVVKKVGHSGSIGKDITTGLGIVVTALATTALIKRTLTPLIATPIAGKLKNRFTEKEVKKPEDDTKEMLEATYKPWLTKTADNKNDLNQDKFEKTVKKPV